MTQQTINMSELTTALHENGVTTSRKHGQRLCAPIDTDAWIGHPFYLSSIRNPTSLSGLNLVYYRLRLPYFPNNANGMTTWAEIPFQCGRMARRETTLQTIAIKPPTHVIMFTDTRPPSNGNREAASVIMDPYYNRQNLKEYNLLHNNSVIHDLPIFGPMPNKINLYDDLTEDLNVMEKDCDFAIGFRTLNQYEVRFPEVFNTHILASYGGSKIYMMMEPTRCNVLGIKGFRYYKPNGKT